MSADRLLGVVSDRTNLAVEGREIKLAGHTGLHCLRIGAIHLSRDAVLLEQHQSSADVVVALFAVIDPKADGADNRSVQFF